MNKKVDFQNKIIVVTGGAGFIGHHLVNEILNLQPKQLIVVDDLSTGKIENLNRLKTEYSFIQKEILDIGSDDLPLEIDFYISSGCFSECSLII